MDRGAWWTTVHRVTKGQTQLHGVFWAEVIQGWVCYIQELLKRWSIFSPLEKEMATHSSIAWEIPRTEEPWGLHSMGLQRVGHDWATEPPPPPHTNTRVIIGMETLFSAWKHSATCRLCPRDLFLGITFPYGCHAARNMRQDVFLYMMFWDW